MKGLTEKQKKVLEYVKNNMTIASPSYREIADHFGVAVKAINDQLVALEKKGYVKLTGRVRGIKIIEKELI